MLGGPCAELRLLHVQNLLMIIERCNTGLYSALLVAGCRRELSTSYMLSRSLAGLDPCRSESSLARPGCHDSGGMALQASRCAVAQAHAGDLYLPDVAGLMQLMAAAWRLAVVQLHRTFCGVHSAPRGNPPPGSAPRVPPGSPCRASWPQPCRLARPACADGEAVSGNEYAVNNDKAHGCLPMDAG